MDEETRHLLDETHALAKDNHRMLRAIRRGQMMSFIGTIVVWLVVLAVPLYFYQHYLQPFVTSTEVTKLINSFKSGQ